VRSNLDAKVVEEQKKVRFSTPDDWVLIKHIGQMQSTNPLRSIKELVDNGIDAFARVPDHSPKEGKIVSVEICKERPKGYIKVSDNAAGWEPQLGSTKPTFSAPDFEYTVRHIGDSIKKYLKEYEKARAEGTAIGQYALGLLSFWALGNRLTVYSRCLLPDGQLGKCSKMIWLRYVEEATIVDDVEPPDELCDRPGSVIIIDELEKARMDLVTGNQLVDSLSRACRSRLMKTEVIVKVYYKREEYVVRPKKYEGTLFPRKTVNTKGGFGSIDLEIYLFPPRVESLEEYKVPIFAKGAKVYDDITQIEELNIYPWNAQKAYGQIDYPHGTISPSRTAFVSDSFLDAFITTMKEITRELSGLIEEIEARKRKRQERKFYEVFQKTWEQILRELPEEWHRKKEGQIKPPRPEIEKPPIVEPGPMYRLEISPQDPQVQCRTIQSFNAKSYDINGNIVKDPSIIYYWKTDGKNLGLLKKEMHRTCIFQAGKDEGITTLTAMAFQHLGESGKEQTITKTASTNIWVVKEPTKKPPPPPPGDRPPLPDEIPLGEDGVHSKYLPETNIVQINNQHKDFLEAKEKGNEALYRYINYCYCKEIAVDRWKNFVVDPHEMSEKITDLVAISEKAFDFKKMAQKIRGRPPKKETVAAWEKRGKIA